MTEPSSPYRRLIHKSSSVHKSNASSPPESPIPGPSSPLRTRPSIHSTRKMLDVFLDALSDEVKSTYKKFSDDLIPSDDEFAGTPLHSIIGEYQHGPKLVYFVKLSKDSQAFQMPSDRVQSKHPKLVEQYKRRKESGLVDLAEFDPQGPHIHPSSRIQLKLNLKKSAAKSSPVESNGDSDSYTSEKFGESEGELGGYSSPDVSLRRSTRNSGAQRSKPFGSTPPFSPKKTRSKARYVISDDEDEDSVKDEGLRRSTRAKKSQRNNLDGDDYEDSRREKTPPVKKIKKKRNPESRPAYGHIRGVADLDYDSDEETKALRAHRLTCEKCDRQQTSKLLLAAQKGKKRRAKKSDDEEEDDVTRLTALGGWVQCLKCPVSAHWGCLARTQRDEILRAILERERAEWRSKRESRLAREDNATGGTHPNTPEPVKRAGLDPDSVTEFICNSCMKGGFCMGCQEVALEPDASHLSAYAPDNPVAAKPQHPDAPVGDVVMTDAPAKETKEGPSTSTSLKELLYRCSTCKRLAHYSHLPPPDPEDEWDAVSLARWYQSTGWRCADCSSYKYLVDHIIAWRPFPAHVVEPTVPTNEPPNYKLPLPREYLVKWQSRSFRRLQWVPHMWLVATNPSKLKNFLAGARPIELLPEPIAEVTPDSLMIAEAGIGEPADDGTGDVTPPVNSTPLNSHGPVLDADLRIQPAWKTVDRVLDVFFWYPQKHYNRTKQRKGKGKATRDTDALDSDDQAAAEKEYEAVFTRGEQPSTDLMETVEEFERRKGRSIRSKDSEYVVWSFIKWNDLGYDAATWDTPPRPNEASYPLFQRAFDRFVASREVTVPIRSKAEIEASTKRHKTDVPRELIFTTKNQPTLGQASELKLMDFQVTGVNWLCQNWWNLQHCILADEMGLGKTVQIVTFLGVIVNIRAFPALVVVPNSTVTNWVREFERWAPQLRVCSFHGDAKARDVIKEYELWHSKAATKTTGAKYHVLVTTFETITNGKEFGPVFKQTPRWEILVVDEGQRLKNDSSLIFKKLGELNTAHRIILTGTPLNNNIRELFNLMNFLDPEKWKDLEKLTKDYEELTQERVQDLHQKLRPYFLRRVKAEVLQLPPKNEVILPVSMAPLQKEIYRSIISQNAALLKSLSGATNVNSTAVKGSKTNMNNILMELRKCLQHPYLISRDIEPAGLNQIEAHEKLIDASAKLRLLKILLPKLKARGHRVLLFSQFSIALDIVEDFLIGEQFRYLRLDGNTKQADRQKGMDEFNKPDSEVFVYLLTTRAGGVGINLWTADTVIIFDPDFNPHQDLQAIARAHRFGQKKTCLVFKLMVKDSAEERIMQTGKKKLVLDHLIVQKMEDADNKEDVQSILMFGAQTLFQEGENQASRDISYSDHDIDNLIEKTEKEGEQQEEQNKEGSLFSFAKVWAADRDALEELEETDQAQQADSWAQTLQRLADEMAQQREQEATGRGVRRRAAAVFPVQQKLDLEDTPKKDKKQSKKAKGKPTNGDDSDAYTGSVADSDADSISNAPSVVPEDLGSMIVDPVPTAAPAPPPLSPNVNTQNLPRPPPKKQKQKEKLPRCGLCGTAHQDGACFMTESGENLAEFRAILLSHAGDETIEERRAAIAIIDETLYKRGQLHLIKGQPLHLVETPIPMDIRPKPVSTLMMQTPSLHTASLPIGTSSNPTTSSSSTVQPPVPQKPRPINGISSKLKPKPNVIEGVSSSTFGSSLSKPKTKKRRVTEPTGKTGHTFIQEHWALADIKAGVSSSPSAPKPQPRVPSNVVASNGVSAQGSHLKRPSSPTKPSSSLKKMKESTDHRCPVCNGTYHLAKDCPVVRKGGQSLQQEIRRLESTSGQEQTVQTLKALLKKQHMREQLAASGRNGA
ncbi:SNF2 family N-terminal domain-containing protein [Cristinia sonorae]|uniref:SNF2 family N-terminal domain-containing protein n=1 Tax=Cristinia sonorae TaxID=1940300 RepID=A0A8K0XNT2_9AGAR|nr:SNF2 family N-terminal domain-containing protein [Cristinia sonorae]